MRSIDNFNITKRIILRSNLLLVQPQIYGKMFFGMFYFLLNRKTLADYSLAIFVLGYLSILQVMDIFCVLYV